MRILIAEDDRVSQTVISEFLKKSGFDVTCVESGDEAWEQFQKTPFRIVITDWRMPGLSGLKLCKMIRESSEAAYTYIIMLTANTNNSSGLAAGADDYVRKPFDPDELRFRIKAGIRVLELEDRLHQQIELLNDSQTKLAEAHQRLQSELCAASDMQRSLLPQPLPPTEAVRFEWSFEPSSDLGGDLFDVQKLADERYAVMMTDVCGHGVKPALLAVALHYVLDNRFRDTPTLAEQFPREERGSVIAPANVLARMNRQFPMDTETAQYFTMFYGVLATDTGEFQYSTAGHPTPILIPEDGEIRQLTGTGVPVGLHSEPDFETQSVMLGPGDRLFLFSDGLVESKRNNGDRVGLQRLMTWLKEVRHLDLNGITSAVSQHVKTWNADERSDDDVSILVVEYSGKAAVRRAALQNLLQDGKTWSLN